MKWAYLEAAYEPKTFHDWLSGFVLHNKSKISPLSKSELRSNGKKVTFDNMSMYGEHHSESNVDKAEIHLKNKLDS